MKRWFTVCGNDGMDDVIYHVMAQSGKDAEAKARVAVHDRCKDLDLLVGCVFVGKHDDVSTNAVQTYTEEPQ